MGVRLCDDRSGATFRGQAPGQERLRNVTAASRLEQFKPAEREQLHIHSGMSPKSSRSEQGGSVRQQGEIKQTGVWNDENDD